ncbi:hypothetical protein YC2023_072178 [Brassica napus]
MKIYQKIALNILMKHAKNKIRIGRVGTLLSLPSVPEKVCSVGLLGPTLSMAGLRSMAGLSPVNFPVTFPANFSADLALLITSQEWLERLMLAGQMNIRRMSGDWIASVCRLCARAPNYRPTILLRSLRNDYHIQGRQQARKLPNPDTGRIHWRASLVPAAAVIPAPIAYILVVAVKKLVVEPWDWSPGPPLVSTGRLVSYVGDMLLALPGRVVPPDFDPIVLAFGIGVMINRDSRCNNPH